MSITFINNTPALRALVLSATTTALTNACRCASLGACAGWESITEDRWPAQMQQLAKSS